MREFDGFSGVAALTGQGWPRAGVRAEGEGVIGGDDAPIAQAEAAGEIEAPGQGANVASGVGGGPGEGLVVVGAEAGEHGAGLLQSGGVGEAKFADQTVLKSAPGAFAAALGRRRIRGNWLAAKFFPGASELGGIVFPPVVGRASRGSRCAGRWRGGRGRG